MSITYVLRKFVVIVDGFGKMGEGEYCKLPVVEVLTDDFRAGGMDTAIRVDLGVQPLVMEFKLSSMDPQVYTKWGLYPGRDIRYVVRGALAHHDGTPITAIATCQGNMHKAESDSWEPARKILHTFTVDLTYYRLQVGSGGSPQLIYEIDPLNGVRIVGGVNQLNNLGRPS